MTKEEIARLAQEFRGAGVGEGEWCVTHGGVFFPAQESAVAYAKNHNLRAEQVDGKVPGWVVLTQR